MADNPPIHLRMPQRAEAIVGKEPQPGTVKPIASIPGPRTVSQDPVTKAKPSFDSGDTS
jgi:hypothetical protein